MKKILVLLMVLSSFVFSSKMIFDYANIVNFDKKMEKDFQDFNGKLLKDYDIDYRVVTTNEDSDINLFANKVFKKFKDKSKSGRVIVMVVNPKQDKVRVEVSQALEPIFTDAFTSYIERKGIVPYFKDNKVSEGIYAMSELITDRAVEAMKGNEFVPPMETRSIGGGAKTTSHFGKGSSKQGELVQSSGSTPEKVLEEYLAVLKKHNKNPNLDIYTEKSKDFFKKWTVTDINQNHEIEFIEKCKKGKRTFYSKDKKYAVMMNHPVKQRTCSPYFFEKVDGQWKLDIYTMAKTLRFNQPMQWHFDMKNKEKYAKQYGFIFDTLSYDKNGYPYIKQKKGRWGFTCSGMYFTYDPKKTPHCWISNIRIGSAADTKLKLEPRDVVIAVGKEKRPASYQEYMGYMKNIPEGEVAYVQVLRTNKDTKKQKKVNLSARAPKKP